MKLSPPIITILQELGPRGQGQHLITQQKETTLTYFTTSTQIVSKKSYKKE
jgi:hypothetical protein